MSLRISATTLVLGLILSTSGFAQNESQVSTRMRSSGDTPNGFRISLVKSFLDAEVKATEKSSGESFSSSDDADQKLGIAIGYAKIPTLDIGFTARLLYSTYDSDESEDPGSLRAEGNITYGFADMIYGFGGFNIHKFTSEGLDELDAGAGLQFGLGAQFTPNLGVDLGYVVMNNEASRRGVDLELQMKGLELSLHGTF